MLTDTDMQREAPESSVSNPTDEESIIITSLDQRKHFRFFDLPRELRDRIYHYALQGLNIKYDFAPKSTLKIPSGEKEVPPAKATTVASYGPQGKHTHTFPRWITSNKQLRKESSEQYYRVVWFNIFSFTYGTLYPRAPPFAPEVPDIRRTTFIRIYTRGDCLNTSPVLSNTQYESCTSCGIVPSSDELPTILAHLASQWKSKQMEMYVTCFMTTSVYASPGTPCQLCELLEALPTGLSRSHVKVITGAREIWLLKEWALFKCNFSRATIAKTGGSGSPKDPDVRMKHPIKKLHSSDPEFWGWECEVTTPLWRFQKEAIRRIGDQAGPFAAHLLRRRVSFRLSKCIHDSGEVTS
jgi:hypothetical protein